MPTRPAGTSTPFPCLGDQRTAQQREGLSQKGGKTALAQREGEATCMGGGLNLRTEHSSVHSPSTHYVPDQQGPAREHESLPSWNLPDSPQCPPMPSSVSTESLPKLRTTPRADSCLVFSVQYIGTKTQGKALILNSRSTSRRQPASQGLLLITPALLIPNKFFQGGLGSGLWWERSIATLTSGTLQGPSTSLHLV